MLLMNDPYVNLVFFQRHFVSILLTIGNKNTLTECDVAFGNAENYEI